MTLFADLYRYVPKHAESSGFSRLIRCAAVMLLHPGWHAIFNFRLAQLMYRLKLTPFAWILYRWNMLLFCIDLHPCVRAGHGLWLPHPFSIVVARDAVIGSECTIYQNATVGGRGDPPVVGSRVVVGAGACVLGPAKVGDNVRIGANGVVVDSVPGNVTVVGVPAREIGSRR